jgi:cell shape-determining protein MreC
MENEKLRTELGLRASSSASYISLELLGDRSNLYGTWYVRKPENKLLYSGQYILGRDNVAVGSVVKDLGGTAEVTYLAHSDKLIIEILERNELIEVEGSGVGMYHGQIPKSSEITIGDTAVLRGYNKSVVGIVSKVDENDTSLKTIWIRAPYNLSKLDIFYAAVE